VGSTTVQHEKGKADVIADGLGSARQVPEGTGEKEAGVPETAKKDDEPGGFINGKPATKQEVERSTRTS
jgi:hypothetical protein